MTFLELGTQGTAEFRHSARGLCRKMENQNIRGLPYTPLGQEALNLTKPANTVRSVLPGETNDPVLYCEPQGMPREDLYELRTTQILQTRPPKWRSSMNLPKR